MSLAIVLVSGGLDSCVTAAIAARRGSLAFLHLRYRQRTEEREFAAFSALADHFQVETRLVVDVDYMRQIGGSSLVDTTQPIPENGDADNLPTTYVPFRNANLLGVAVAWAEVIDATDIYIGAHEAESHYPDCRREFFTAYERMVAAGTSPQTQVRIQTPLIGWDKAAIVRCGLALTAPLHLTWPAISAKTSPAAAARVAACAWRAFAGPVPTTPCPTPLFQGANPC